MKISTRELRAMDAHMMAPEQFWLSSSVTFPNGVQRERAAWLDLSDLKESTARKF